MVDLAERPSVAAQALSESCTGFPAPLATALQKIPQVPAEMRISLEVKAISEAPETWTAGCKGGLRVLQEAAALNAEQRGAWLFRQCAPDFLTAEEAGHANAQLMLAIALSPSLSEVSRDLRVRYLRSLSGV